MFNPHVGRVTSEYGARSGGFHAGIDIAPPTPGTTGTPVYAAFSGTVDRAISGRRPGQSAASGATIAPGRSGNGLMIRNPDGERQLYNHITPTVRTGARVREGDLIGHTDRSGIQTGPHLHFEVWNAAGSTRNPRVDFTKFGITPGRASADGGGTPTPPPAGGSSTLRRGSTGAPVRALQTALNKWKTALPKLAVDGTYGPRTEARVREWQTRNHGGAYPRRNTIDGVAGPVTLRALGLT